MEGLDTVEWLLVASASPALLGVQQRFSVLETGENLSTRGGIYSLDGSELNEVFLVHFFTAKSTTRPLF